MILLMTLLVVRRRLDEIGTARNTEIEAGLLRSMMAAVSTGEARHIEPRERRPALAVAARLSELLRGGERESLTELVGNEGLLDGPLRRLRARRTSRRLAAIRQLETFRAPPVIHALERVMANDESIALRIAAGSALGRMGELPGVRDTISMLGLASRPATMSDEVVLRVLAETNGEAVADAAADSGYVSLRAALVEALGSSSDGEVGDFLGIAVDDPAPQVRSAAARSLARYAHSRRSEWLARLAVDEDAHVRLEALLAFERLESSIEPALLERLKLDGSPLIAAHADRFANQMSRAAS